METEMVELDKGFVTFLREFNSALEIKLGKRLGMRASSIILLELIQNNKIIISLKTHRRDKRIDMSKAEINPLDIQLNVGDMHI